MFEPEINEFAYNRNVNSSGQLHLNLQGEPPCGSFSSASEDTTWVEVILICPCLRMLSLLNCCFVNIIN
ncbi:hypothetical protein NC651_010188 [Populus alba x Populus x berolinensis]|nr:hypothetical protein NC651_010188 [Populus alba x Populus x berolinensis]